MAVLAKLNDKQVKQALPAAKPYKLTDGGGLYVLVKPDGAKYWRYNYSFQGKGKTLQFGVYPDMTLAAVREAHQAARAKVRSGSDPSHERKMARLGAKHEAGSTFREVGEAFWEAKRKAGRSVAYIDEVIAKLEKDVYPWIGSRRPDEITEPEIYDILQRVEQRAPETARRLRGFMGEIFRHAIRTGKAKLDPTLAMRGAIITRAGGHFAAITDPAQFAELLGRMMHYGGDPVTVALMCLSPLVFQRPTELRAALWSEFDLDGKAWGTPMWEIQPQRDPEAGGTKIGNTGWESHLVPLSRQAVAILRALWPITGRTGLVFHSSRKPGNPISDGTVLGALRRMGYAGRMTTHGFRASARTLAAERLKVPNELLELQISHRVVDPLGRAYNRTTWLDERIEFMQKWADYLDRLRVGATVLPMARRA
jgi:integrase